jgi:hypothetical protein
MLVSALTPGKRPPTYPHDASKLPIVTFFDELMHSVYNQCPTCTLIVRCAQNAVVPADSENAVRLATTQISKSSLAFLSIHPGFPVAVIFIRRTVSRGNPDCSDLAVSAIHVILSRLFLDLKYSELIKACKARRAIVYPQPSFLDNECSTVFQVRMP